MLEKLQETKKENISNGYKNANSYELIRQHAHRMMRYYGKPQQCAICGYDRHVEVCHIKSIADFSDNALLSEINSKANLVYLCPNHHWELDNGFLTL